MSEATFMGACLSGDALLDEVDDWVDRWHDADGRPDGDDVPLREYLGLNKAEYAMWVEQPASLRFAAAARRSGRRVQDVRAFVTYALAAARTNDDNEAHRLVAWLRETGRLSDDDLAG